MQEASTQGAAQGPQEHLNEPGTIILKEWMWHGEGLALKPGSIKLMVYGLVYGSYQSGRGLFCATQRNISDYLQVGHASVERAFKELLEDGLIDVRGVVFNKKGKASPTYVISVPPAQRAIDSLQHVAGDCPLGFGMDAKRFAERLGKAAEESDAAKETAGQIHPQIEGESESFQQTAGQVHPQNEGNSDSFTLKMRNYPQNEGESPYRVRACVQEETTNNVDNFESNRKSDLDLKNTYVKPSIRISEPASAAGAGGALTGEDLKILSEIVRDAVKPVEPRFMKAVEAAFRDLVCKRGIPAKTVQDAHDRYIMWFKQAHGPGEVEKAVPLTTFLRPLPETGKLNTFLEEAAEEAERKRCATKAELEQMRAREFSRCLDMGVVKWFANGVQLQHDVKGSLELYGLRGREQVSYEELVAEREEEIALRSEKPAEGFEIPELTQG